MHKAWAQLSCQLHFQHSQGRQPGGVMSNSTSGRGDTAISEGAHPAAEHPRMQVAALMARSKRYAVLALLLHGTPHGKLQLPAALCTARTAMHALPLLLLHGALRALLLLHGAPLTRGSSAWEEDVQMDTRARRRLHRAWGHISNSLWRR